MNNFGYTLLEVNVLLICLWIIFKVIQQHLSFQQQRFSIASIPALSILVVLFKNRLISSGGTFQHSILKLNLVTIHPDSIASANSYYVSFEVGYWSISACFAAFFIYRLTKVLSFFLSANVDKKQNFRLVHIPGKDSFSFFNWIQIEPDLSSENREIVLQHEIIHAKKKHSIDLIYIEILQCVFWFNPILILLKKDLVNVHEFEVDQIMYSRYKKEYMHFLLAYALGTSSSSYLLTHRFLRKLTLVKRIKIMEHKKKKRSYLAFILPITALSFALVSWTTPNKADEGKQAAAIKSLTTSDKPAEYKGGMDALINYLSTSIHYPKDAQKNNISGKVVVSFVISETGKVIKAKVVKGVNSELDAEAIRVVEAMPDWTPAVKEGKNVSTEMQLPINFAL